MGVQSNAAPILVQKIQELNTSAQGNAVTTSSSRPIEWIALPSPSSESIIPYFAKTVPKLLVIEASSHWRTFLDKIASDMKNDKEIDYEDAFDRLARKTITHYSPLEETHIVA
jgi:hypothetical protein